MWSISFSFVCCAVLAIPVSASRLLWNRDDQCGVEASTNLIHHNPWLVYLEYFRGDRPYEVRCGGTLVDNRHIITAAHCVTKHHFSHLVVRFGEYDLESDVDCVRGICSDPVLRVEVDQMTVHEAYDGQDNDIAILRLKEAVPYTDFIRPICLPTVPASEKTLFSAAGWGEIPSKGYYSHIKKILLLPFWDHQSCAAAYPGNEIPTTIICAGGERDIDTCRGDSGGPLTVVREKVELAGVTSAGNIQCGTEGAPAFYTDVFLYRDWIDNVLYNVE